MIGYHVSTFPINQNLRRKCFNEWNESIKHFNECNESAIFHLEQIQWHGKFHFHLHTITHWRASICLVQNHWCGWTIKLKTLFKQMVYFYERFDCIILVKFYALLPLLPSHALERNGAVEISNLQRMQFNDSTL